jgi:cell division protease FtsH
MYSRITHTSRVRRLRPSVFLPLALLAAITIAGCDRAGVDPTEIPYSALKQRIAAGEVREVRLSSSRIEALPTDAARAAGAPARWEAIPVAGDVHLVELLEKQGVVYHAEGPARVSIGAVVAVVAVVALVALVAVHLRTLNPARGALGMGRSKLRDARARTGTRFQDVAGVDEAREELEEIVRFLQQPARFAALGARTPKGVLLVGPPGTGKTLLARAVAGEANVPFFSVSGSEFLEVFVGVGASRVRRLFRQAKAQAPAIIFIDELDAIGKSRSATSGSGANDEREHTLNQLLVEMDGFDPRDGLIIMGATNRAETLDVALLRPGRFDRQVLVDRPDASGREAILRVHARKLQLAPDVDLAVLARRTPGFVGADLENVLNEAALLAARADKSAVGMIELEAAIDRVVAGLEKKQKRISDKERRIVAYHEAGHAIVAELAPTAEPVRKVSIVPRGLAALGYVQQSAEERHLLQEDELRDRLAVLLGGRAAEHIIFRQLSTGASNDLERATALARRMVCEFGMSTAVGPVAFANPSNSKRGGEDATGWSEQVTAQIEQEVQALLSSAFDQACESLSHRRSALDAVADALLERGNLDRDELLDILARTAQ